MITNEIISKAVSDIDNWLPNYLNLPYKHLGNDRSGIDCFNLCALIYREVLNIEIPYTTQDSGCDVSVNWYDSNLTANILIDRATPKWGWDIVTEPISFDIVLMSIGATSAPNHCALFLDNKILQIMEGRPSCIAEYKRYYKQYTVKVGRWKNDFKL